PTRSLLPYTTLFRSHSCAEALIFRSIRPNSSASRQSCLRVYAFDSKAAVSIRGVQVNPNIDDAGCHRVELAGGEHKFRRCSSESPLHSPGYSAEAKAFSLFPYQHCSVYLSPGPRSQAEFEPESVIGR